MVFLFTINMIIYCIILRLSESFFPFFFAILKKEHSALLEIDATSNGISLKICSFEDCKFFKEILGVLRTPFFLFWHSGYDFPRFYHDASRK